MHFYKDKILSDGQLKRLSEHKYSSESSSLLDAFLQPYWNWLVRQVPIWLAPNLITLSGLIINIVTTLILIYYSADAKSDVSCVYFSFYHVLISIKKYVIDLRDWNPISQ